MRPTLLRCIEVVVRATTNDCSRTVTVGTRSEPGASNPESDSGDYDCSQHDGCASIAQHGEVSQYERRHCRGEKQKRSEFPRHRVQPSIKRQYLGADRTRPGFTTGPVTAVEP
jgi:hypothetical protein